MVMSDDFIFIHCPRTAGRSIAQTFGLYPPKRDDHWHWSVQKYLQVLGSDEFNRRFKFSVVRNPWDRVFDWWFFFRLTPSGEPAFRTNPNYVRDTFNTWVLNDDRKDRTNGMYGTPFDQLTLCRDSQGQLRVDNFLRFERLDSDFEMIKQKLNPPNPLPHIDEGRRSHLRPYQAYYSYESMERVRDHNLFLIKKFGYEF